MPWVAPTQGSASFVASKSFTITATGENNGLFQLQAGTSYVLLVNLSGAAAYADSIKISILWSVTPDGNTVVDKQMYYVMAGNTKPHPFRITGPADTTTMTISIDGGFATASPVVSYSLYQGVTPQQFHSAKSVYQTADQPDYPVVGAPDFVEARANVCFASATVAAAGFAERALPFWTGPTGYSGSTASALADGSIEVGQTALTNFAGAVTLTPQMKRLSTAAGGLFNGSFAGTNVQGTMVFRNNNAAAKNMFINFQYASLGSDSIGSNA